jgi:phage terminase small subunit
MESQKSKREDIFAREYVIDFNATRAALAAGYSPTSASESGCELLRKSKVTLKINDLLSKRASKLGIKAERVVEEIARLANSNIEDFLSRDEKGGIIHPVTLDFSRVSRDQLAAVQEIKVDEYGGGSGDGERRQVLRTTFKLAPKDKALDMLMRHLGAYNDKLAVRIDMSTEIVNRLNSARKRREGK